MWDPSSPTRDQTCVLCSGSSESQPLNCQGRPRKSIFYSHIQPHKSIYTQSFGRTIVIILNSTRHHYYYSFKLLVVFYIFTHAFTFSSAFHSFLHFHFLVWELFPLAWNFLLVFLLLWTSGVRVCLFMSLCESDFTSLFLKDIFPRHWILFSFLKYLFFWPCQVLVVAHGIFVVASGILSCSIRTPFFFFKRNKVNSFIYDTIYSPFSLSIF